MKKALVFVLTICILTSFVAMAKSNDEFLSVRDDASMLSEATERYIYTQNHALGKKTDARIIVATIETAGEMSTYERAREIYDALGVHRIGRNNSVFILLCKEDKDYSIIVSDGINAVLTDSYAQKCLGECLEPDFAKGKYDDAVIKTFNAFANWYETEYNTSLELTEDLADYDAMIKNERRMELVRTIITIVLSAAAFVGAIWAIVRYRHRKKMQRLLKKRQERRRRYAQSLRG